MKKILLWILVFAFVVGLAHAQDAATQQQIDELSGQSRTLIDTQAAQGNGWKRWRSKSPT